MYPLECREVLEKETVSCCLSYCRMLTCDARGRVVCRDKEKLLPLGVERASKMEWHVSHAGTKRLEPHVKWWSTLGLISEHEWVQRMRVVQWRTCARSRGTRVGVLSG